MTFEASGLLSEQEILDVCTQYLNTKVAINLPGKFEIDSPNHYRNFHEGLKYTFVPLPDVGIEEDFESTPSSISNELNT